MPFPKNVASGQSRKIIARTQLLAINFIPFVLAQIADDDSGAPLPWLHPGCRPEAIVLRSEAKPHRSWFSRLDRLGQSLADLGRLPGWPKMPGQLANNFGLGPSVHRDRRVTGRCQQQIFIKNEHGDGKVVKQIRSEEHTSELQSLSVHAFITNRKRPEERSVG